MQKNILRVMVLMLIALVPFSARADTLWSANGLNISNTNSGFVGIGTTGPGATLDVFGGSGASASGGAMRMISASGINYLQSGTSYSSSAADLRFTSMNAGTTWMTVRGSTGSVGIGTTSPGEALDVNGNIKSSTIALKGTTPNSSYPVYLETANTGSFFRFVDTNTGGGNIQMSSGGSATPSTLFINDVDGVLINHQNASYLAFATNNAEKVRIESGGNVGIGTAAPASLLHVSAATATFTLGNSSTQYLEFIGRDDTDIMEITAKSAEVASTDINFKIANTAGTENSVMYMAGSTGNVGIGTAEPGAKLDVNGDANINGNLKLAGNITSNEDICIGVCP